MYTLQTSRNIFRPIYRSTFSKNCSVYQSSINSINPVEYIILPPNAQQTLKHAETLCSQYRPHLKILQSNDHRLSSTSCFWYFTNQQYMLDCCPLDINQSASTSSHSIARQWNELINERMGNEYFLKTDPNYERELNVATSIISKGCFISRSHQHRLQQHQQHQDCQGESAAASVKKVDSTLVTSVDFAMQALIIERLAQEFPDDKFIAEEDSRLLQENPELCEEVIKILQLSSAGRKDDAAAAAPVWTKEKLFHFLDKGSFAGNVCQERVWTLDPIDGTKGFVCGLHYCISIILLDHGKPAVSVIGCPNLNLFQMLRRKGDASMIAIDEDVTLSEPSLPMPFPFSDRGSLYYAVTGSGAYARSLTMPLDASIQVHVSNRSKLEESTLAEASETSRHDHHMTKAVASLAKLRSEAIRVHSQCKYCIIGIGGAEGTVRYPPFGYVERVWDHAPGAHFVKEAGGLVTDLHGFELEVNIGRNLDHHVRGIIASNGKIHDQLLLAVRTALQP